MLRVIHHLEPFDSTGIDCISILDAPIGSATRIPFNDSKVREWQERYDPKRHFTMDGRIPDTLHRFIRPSGVPLEFLVKDDKIIQMNDHVDEYRRT